MAAGQNYHLWSVVQWTFSFTQRSPGKRCSRGDFSSLILNNGLWLIPSGVRWRRGSERRREEEGSVSPDSSSEVNNRKQAEPRRLRDGESAGNHWNKHRVAVVSFKRLNTNSIQKSATLTLLWFTVKTNKRGFCRGDLQVRKCKSYISD